MNTKQNNNDKGTEKKGKNKGTATIINKSIKEDKNEEVE